jgi:ribosomal protein S12 methylthiotransferase
VTRVGLISLGCPKALVDSEQMMALLAKEGYEIVLGDQDCDILFINTCSFIGDAREESEQTIKNAIKLKRAGKIKRIVVTGCLPQLVGEQIKERCKGVDAFLGTGKNDLAVLVANGSLAFERSPTHAPQGSPLPRLQLTLPHVAYLRVAEGCSHKCSFCTIPSIRGPYHSFELKDLVLEAKALASIGVKEIIIIAQDTSIVGLDAKDPYDLKKLMEELSQIDGIEWIRVMYLNPMHLTENVLAALTVKKVLPYFDIPFQHISDKILSAMGRPSPGRDDIRLLIKTIRGSFKNAILRSSIIVGFPGEDRKDFDELVSFIRETSFDRLGVFRYSPEENTLSYKMRQVSSRVANYRWNTLMALQSEISLENNSRLKGQILPVIIDGIGKDTAIGRSMADAPEIDGTVSVKGANIKRGDIVNVKVNSFSPYDLGGVKVGH